MDSYVVLTNRKRAFIALIHSVLFLLIASRSVAKPSFVGPIYALQGSALKASAAFIAIYVIVTVILLQLARISQSSERLYFALCATSAGFGLLRYSLGDPAIHVAIYIRVIALLMAVGVGTMIYLGHAPQKSAA
jgi:hypothetical protein